VFSWAFAHFLNIKELGDEENLEEKKNFNVKEIDMGHEDHGK
jgi:hypothetical protein